MMLDLQCPRYTKEQWRPLTLAYGDYLIPEVTRKSKTLPVFPTVEYRLDN